MLELTRRRMLVSAGAVWAASQLPRAVSAADDWGPIQFLVGHWSGEGSGEPGKGTGAFSFLPDVQGHVLVRKNFAEYPPAEGKPASRHDDLTIIYMDETSNQLKAIYFDNEGHVIRYLVDPVDQGAVFTSEGGRDVTRYRLTYTKKGEDRLIVKFEVAPPSKDFATYIEAVVQREKSN